MDYKILKVNADEAISYMQSGNASLCNTESGVILIPDIVDGGDRDDEEYGFRAGNGDWIYGVMEGVIPPEKISEIINEGESLEQYALGHFPAPGTLADNKLIQFCTDSAEDLKDLILEFFAEEPPSWIVETINN